MGDDLEIRVWWIPQVPMEPFLYRVQTVEAGRTLCDALAKYDLFQLNHNIKPDFSNAGGIAWRHPAATNGERWDIDPDDEDGMAGFAALAKLEGGR